jgi:glucose-1-phosphate cytidylyltransferase
MKVVILAGGFGTRISEDSHLRPKPMIEIGDRPILWHIMKIYAHYGFNDFVICLGYKSYVIKEYFANYFLHASDVTFDFTKENHMVTHSHSAEPWRITLVETGLETMTGGRIKRIQKFVENRPFMLTYGDGVADVDIHALIRFHERHGKIATITGVQPAARFGSLALTDSGAVTGFQEKPIGESGWINGGFMVMQPKIFDLIDGDSTILEREPIERLAAQGQLQCFRHNGFWQPMDTLRDRLMLEKLWQSTNPPWKTWK